MKFEIGKTYGSYEFLDPLGSSKTILAYRVRNVLEQRVELLRILPQMLGGDQERMERFLREIRVRARVVHPNIVTFYHAGELEGQLIMTTELVEGPTLAERLELGPMPYEEATAMMIQVLSALHYAHENGIVHREVTPANIILTPDKIVKLSGFGLAKGVSDAHLTQVGAVMGDLKYMPPEQVKGADNLDGRSDIYSAGAVLYEAVTGSPPFGAKSQFDLMLAQVSATPRAPSTLRPLIPADLDTIIMTALAKELPLRYQSANEFRAALESLSDGLQTTEEPYNDTDRADTPHRPGPVIPIASDSVTAVEALATNIPSMTVRTTEPAAAPQLSPPWGSLELTLVGVSVLLFATMVFFAFLIGRN